MARVSASLAKSIVAAAKCSRSAAPRTSPIRNVLSEASSGTRRLSSRISCLRGAIVSLESLQPFLSTRSEACFVSRLSSGAHDSSILLRDDEDGT